MAYRIIDFEIWRDPWFDSLSSQGKLLFFFLITSPHNDKCGTQPYAAGLIGYHCGLSRVELESILVELQEKVSVIDGRIFCHAFARHQHRTGNFKAGIPGCLRELSQNIQERIKIVSGLNPVELGLNPVEPNSIEVEPSLTSVEPANKIQVTSNKIQDTRKEKNKDKEKGAAQVPIPENLSSSLEFLEAWERWQEFRTSKKKPVSAMAAKEQLGKLSAMGPEDAVLAISNSIAGDYQGLFPPKKNFESSRQSAFSETMSFLKSQVTENEKEQP